MKNIQAKSNCVDSVQGSKIFASAFSLLFLGIFSASAMSQTNAQQVDPTKATSVNTVPNQESSSVIKPEEAQGKKLEKDVKAPTASDLKFEGSGAIVAQEELINDSFASRISGYASFQYTLKAYNTPSERDRDQYAYTLGAGYKVNQQYSLGVSASIYNNEDETEKRDQIKLESVAVSLSRVPYQLPRNYKLKPSLSIRAPVGRDTVKRESLLLGLNPSASLELPVTDWTGVSALSTKVQLSGLWNVHEYRQSATGASNTQYGYTTALMAGYSFPKDVSLSASLAYNSAWTYRQSQIESLGHSESISWAFIKNATASLGHSNRGPLFAYSGVNYDYELISERSSYFFGELTASF